MFAHAEAIAEIAVRMRNSISGIDERASANAAQRIEYVIETATIALKFRSHVDGNSTDRLVLSLVDVGGTYGFGLVMGPIAID